VDSEDRGQSGARRRSAQAVQEQVEQPLAVALGIAEVAR
jgi:hypothetical protein